MAAVGGVLSTAAAVALAGCTASVRPEVAYVEVSSAPVELRSYPHTVYDGRDVYYVNDRWMYNDGGRWAYYRQEPAPLVQYRRSPQYAPAPVYSQPRQAPVQVAPPAYQQPGYSQPRRVPAQPQAAPPQVAPPAVRTR